jgi:hypothetical protein
MRGMTIEGLKREALALDATTRASLAHDLLVGLDDLSEAEVEKRQAIIAEAIAESRRL